MEEWKEYRLKDICIKVTDGSHSSPKAQDTGYPMFSVKDMVEFGFDYSKCKYISKEDFIRLKDSDCVPLKGDVLVAKDGSYLKEIFVCKETKEEAILSSIAIFRPNTNYVYSEFLCYLLKTPIVFNYIATNCVSGSALPRIVLKDFKEIILNIPSLPTQQKIANILSSLDDKIEVNRRINENLEAQAQALFKSWFVDFEPFKDGEFVESELGMIPKGWRVKRLEEVSKLIAGGDKPDVVSLNKTDDTPYAIYSNGIDNYGLYGFSDNYRIKEESVTVSARGTIGYVCLREEPYTPIVRLISVIPDTNFISAKYMYHSLKIKPIQGTGTTQQQLTVPMFRNTLLVIPSQELMDSFTIKVNSMFELRRNNQQEITRLASLRDTLLPKLMSGEVDVNDVKI